MVNISCFPTFLNLYPLLHALRGQEISYWVTSGIIYFPLKAYMGSWQYSGRLVLHGKIPLCL